MTPEECGIRDDAGMPEGIGIELDSDTKQVADDVLFGGSPARLMRFNQSGAGALTELRSEPVRSSAAALLARRLTDAGMAPPRPPPAPAQLDVTVVVPVRDRALQLARCLAALGGEHPVIVVDDGSHDPGATEAVCAAYGARLLCHQVNRGPGPARNTALRLVHTEFVAFIDSDCVPPANWVSSLAAHFADPLVAAVAPRVMACEEPAITAVSRYALARSPLDLGDRPARVFPMTRVSYVPTAALVVRRTAVADGFDEQLRFGEDVDLIWRLIEQGWRVRYEPAVQVRHIEPTTWRALLRRRYQYGTSAAPLTRRHPGTVAPLVLQPWPTLTVAALLARRPLLAGATFGTGTALLIRRLRSADVPARGVLRPMAEGVRQTWLGIGRWSSQFAVLPLVAAVICPGGAARRSRWGRRMAVVSLLVGPPVTEWVRRKPALDAVRFGLAFVADDAAYGTGVWAGCLRERCWMAVLPTISWNVLKPRTPRSSATPHHRRKHS